MTDGANRIPGAKSWADEIDDLYQDATENRLRAAFFNRARDRLAKAETADDQVPDGFGEDEVHAVLCALDAADRFDYFNITLGTSNTVQGAVHIVPPMSVAPAYVAPYAARIKRATRHVCAVDDNGQVNSRPDELKCRTKTFAALKAHFAAGG